MISKLFRPYMDPRVLAIGLIAYANGIPALLTASTLAVWLKEYGLSYSEISLFSLVHLPYIFKFVWAPILDQVQIPFLGRYMGQRKSWLFLLQLLIIVGLMSMAQLSPREDIYLFALLGLMISTAAASQHVLLLAYQVQTLDSREWGVGEGMSVFGFRMGILTAGAGALYLASVLPWAWVYMTLAFIMLLGLLIVAMVPEPSLPNLISYPKGARFVQKCMAWFRNVVWESYSDFMKRPGWLLILGFMIFYRMPDHLLGAMPNLFFLELGFSKVEVATVSKAFGLFATIMGGFMGGLLLREWSFQKTLLFAGIFHGASMVCFLIQNQVGYHMPTLYTTIALEHFSSGLGLTAFFSYQLSVCNPKFAATQLALMTAVAAIGTRFGNLVSGFIIDALSWHNFFTIVTLSSVPGIFWVFLLPNSQGGYVLTHRFKPVS